jgi:AsmA protein
MRRILIVVAVVVVIVVLGALLAPVLINVDRFRPSIQAQLQKKLDRPVVLGPLSLRVIPLSIKIAGLTIGESPAFHTSHPFATAKDVSASAELFSLLRGSPVIKSVSLTRPQIELVRNTDGTWNFATIGGTSAASSSSDSQSTFTLDKLTIDDGQIALTDLSRSQPRAVYDHIDLKLTDVAPKKPFDIDLDAHLPGEGKQQLSLTAKVGPIPAGNVAASPIDGSLTLKEVSLSGVSRFLNGATLANTESTISGKTGITSGNGPISAKGSLKFENTTIHGVKIEYPITADYNAVSDGKQNITNIQSAELKLGSTPISLSGQINSGQTPASINMQVSTQNAPLADLGRLASAFGAFDPQYRVSAGTLTLNVHVQGPPSQPSSLIYSGSGQIANATATAPSFAKPLVIANANLQFAQNSASVNNLALSLASTSVKGNLSVSQFAAPQIQFALTADQINTAELEQFSAAKTPSAGTQPTGQPARQPTANTPGLLSKVTGGGTLAANTILAHDIALNNVRATVKLNNGVVELSPLTADIFGGKETGTVTVDTRPANPTCSVNANLTGVDTNKLLSATSSLKDTLYGSLAGNGNLSFILGSGTDLARTLNGKVGFNVTNGQLKNVNILNEVARIGQFMGAAPGQNQAGTALKRLSGTMDIRNGLTTTNDLTAALDAGSLSGNGTLNLVDQGINMHVRAVLASGPSNSVGGSKVGGYLNTALANNKGELVVPVLVTGTLAKPAVAPDVNALAEMKLKNLLPTTGDPANLTTGLVGSVLGNLTGKQQQNQNQNQQQNQSPLKSIFDALGQKKKQQK